MRSRNISRLQSVMVLFCISLTSILILSCSSSSGDNDGGNDNPQTYNASGTYVFDSGTGVLTATFTYSEFPGCGPSVCIETYDVDSITATTMVWNEGEEDMLIWERDSGIPDDITGIWDRIDDIGNTYELAIDANGSINVIADIVECSDGGQCNIITIVRIHTGAFVTGATVNTDGKSCTTLDGTCTINNVTPCGETFRVTAEYGVFGELSDYAITNPKGGTSQVEFRFDKP